MSIYPTIEYSGPDRELERCAPGVVYVAQRHPRLSVFAYALPRASESFVMPGSTVETPIRELESNGIMSDGFEWGYAGTGPHALAAALLEDLRFYDGERELYLSVSAIVELQSRFAHEVIARLPKPGWSLTAEQILAWISKTGQADALVSPEVFPR